MRRHQGERLSPLAMLATGASEIPEDVLAERDAEERRIRPAPPAPASTLPLPDDVRAEQDLEVQRADEEQRLEQAEGQPPEEAEPRP